MDKKVLITVPERQFGLCYLLLDIFVLPRLFAFLLPQCFPGISVAGVNFSWHLTSFMVLICVFRRFLLASLHTFCSRIVPVLVYSLVGLVLYWTASWLMSLLLSSIQPGFANINDQTVSTLFSQNFILMAVATAVLAPITEEILYRGVLFDSLYSKTKAGALILSSLLFALIHIVTYVGKYPVETLLLCFLQYLPAGLCLGWVYGKSKNLLAPILIHMVVNTMGILALR